MRSTAMLPMTIMSTLVELRSWHVLSGGVLSPSKSGRDGAMLSFDLVDIALFPIFICPDGEGFRRLFSFILIGVLNPRLQMFNRGGFHATGGEVRNG